MSASHRRFRSGASGRRSGRSSPAAAPAWRIFTPTHRRPRQIGAKTFETLDTKVAEEAVANLLADKMWNEGAFVKAELESMANGLRLLGEVQGDIDWAKAIDDRYLPADLRGLR